MFLPKNFIPFALGLFMLASPALSAEDASSVDRSPQSRYPEDIQEAIKLLPDKALTLPFIMAQAIEHADSFRAIVANAPGTKSPSLLARSALDTFVTAEYSYFSDDTQQAPGTIIDPQNNKAYELGISKKFFTGTSLSAKIESANSEFVNNLSTEEIESEESTFTLGIEQSLWKDFLGWSTRKKVEAGKLASEVALDQVFEGTEDWALALAQTYYNAWLNKERVIAAREKLRTQRNLTRITKLRVNRGSSARTELLQIESAYILAQTQEAESAEALQKVWRQLVMLVKLPTQWLKVDPVTVPMLTESDSLEMVEYCSGLEKQLVEKGQSGKLEEVLENPRVKRFQKNAEAQELAYEASRWDLWPELAVYGQYGSNALDDNADGNVSNTVAEPFDFANKFWALGVKFSMPIGFRANRAEVYTQTSNRMKARAEADGAIADLELELMGACADLSRLVKNRKLLETSVAKQKERNELEERRFQSGRVTIREAIQASNDYTDARFQASQNTANLHLAMWNLRKLRGEINKNMRDVVAKYYE